QNWGDDFKIGVRVVALGAPGCILLENRCFFTRYPVKSRRVFFFDIYLSVADLSGGAYTVYCNVLREGVFWFKDIGIPDQAVDFKKQASVVPVESVTCPTQKKGMHIAIFSSSFPYFDRESGGNRLLELLVLLRRNHIAVTFFTDEYPKHQESKNYSKILEKNGIQIFCDYSKFVFQLRQDKFVACIFVWYAAAVKYLDKVKKIAPHARIIVDSVDVRWVRDERGVQAGLITVDSAQACKNKEVEKITYQKADTIWTVTEEDRQAILKELPASDVRIVSNIHRKNNKFVSKPRGIGILFVGGFTHLPNESAALWGAEIVKCFRQKTGVDCVYYVVGNKPSQRLRDLDDGKHTIVTGYVKDLYPYYRRSKVFLAPIRYGGGIKGKICHTLCSGIPVITNALGNEGINLIHGQEGLIANTTSEFVQCLESVFSQDIDLVSLARRGMAKVLSITQAQNAWDTIYHSLVYKPVVVAIVSHNKKELLRHCLDSIISKTVYPDYKIAVVCNGCQDGSREMMQEYVARYPRLIDFYFNKQNEYFVKPNNFIIHKYKSRDVVLVNNDIEIITPGWLTHLYEAAYISEKVGAAGGKILSPSGDLSEAGALLYNDGTGRNMGRGEPSDKPEYNISRYVGYVSGCLLYMRRDAIKRFGVLDEDFSPMYYEDSEWQYRLHRQDIYSVYTPLSVAIHYEGSSAGTQIDRGMKQYQEINRKKFLEKMHGVPVESLNPGGGLIFSRKI
ncbi:MAG: glycosyltransferase, partial [Candidatus Omnitrophica bacterium]|nr:glycosyltransferase [Candidatus Omnitrophota bacterium]